MASTWCFYKFSKVDSIHPLRADGWCLGSRWATMSGDPNFCRAGPCELGLASLREGFTPFSRLSKLFPQVIPQGLQLRTRTSLEIRPRPQGNANMMFHCKFFRTPRSKIFNNELRGRSPRVKAGRLARSWFILQNQLVRLILLGSNLLAYIFPPPGDFSFKRAKLPKSLSWFFDLSKIL